MYQNEKPKKKNNWLTWIILLLVVAPDLFPLALIGGVIYLVVKGSKEAKPRERERYTSLNQPHGVPRDCDHKDKSFHNVRRGKEIDPWDRPDIDISKYQRRE